MAISFFSLPKDHLRSVFSEQGIAEGSDSESEGEKTDTGVCQPESAKHYNDYAYRQLLFRPPAKTLEELLAILLRKIAHAFGEACGNYLQELVIFLKANEQLVAKIPQNSDANPLELAVSKEYFAIALELQIIGMQIRPENYLLIRKLERFNARKEQEPSQVPSYTFSAKAR